MTFLGSQDLVIQYLPSIHAPDGQIIDGFTTLVVLQTWRTGNLGWGVGRGEETLKGTDVSLHV